MKRTKFPVSVVVNQTRKEILTVDVLSCTDDVILLNIGTTTKYLEPEGYFENTTIIFPENVEVIINSPFENSVLSVSVQKYNLFVTLFNKRLIDDYLYGNDVGQRLYTAVFQIRSK